MYRARSALDKEDGWYGPYMRELSIAKALRHPHLVALKAFFVQGPEQCPTFVFEWAPCSLRATMQRASQRLDRYV